MAGLPVRVNSSNTFPQSQRRHLSFLLDERVEPQRTRKAGVIQAGLPDEVAQLAEFEKHPPSALRGFTQARIVAQLVMRQRAAALSILEVIRDV
jgi:hypothetical protein